MDAMSKLRDISDIAMIKFDADDVVRHPVVSAIINAYDEEER